MNENFSYSGSSISIALKWSNNSLTLTLYKIGSEYTNGDLFFSDKFLIDGDEEFLNYICFPCDSIHSTPKNPFVYQIDGIPFKLFELICKIIKDFDYLSVQSWDIH